VAVEVKQQTVQTLFLALLLQRLVGELPKAMVQTENLEEVEEAVLMQLHPLVLHRDQGVLGMLVGLAP
jgi:hypothetical protein